MKSVPGRITQPTTYSSIKIMVEEKAKIVSRIQIIEGLEGQGKSLDFI